VPRVTATCSAKRGIAPNLAERPETLPFTPPPATATAGAVLVGKEPSSVRRYTCVDAFQDQHTNALERAARRGSSLQRLLRRPVRPVPWSGQTGHRRQIGDEAYER